MGGTEKRRKAWKDRGRQTVKGTDSPDIQEDSPISSYSRTGSSKRGCDRVEPHHGLLTFNFRFIVRPPLSRPSRNFAQEYLTARLAVSRRDPPIPPFAIASRLNNLSVNNKSVSPPFPSDDIVDHRLTRFSYGALRRSETTRNPRQILANKSNEAGYALSHPLLVRVIDTSTRAYVLTVDHLSSVFHHILLL